MQSKSFVLLKQKTNFLKSFFVKTKLEQLVYVVYIIIISIIKLAN